MVGSRDTVRRTRCEVLLEMRQHLVICMQAKGYNPVSQKMHYVYIDVTDKLEPEKPPQQQTDAAGSKDIC